MPQEKKTADMKSYQAAYRKANPKNKEKTNEYMKNYIKEAPDVDCPICGGHFKSYAKYKHDRTKKHLEALIAIKDKEEKAAAKKAEEEAVEKAKQEAEAAEAAKAAKPKITKTIRVKKSSLVKARPPKPTRPVPQPKTKAKEKTALELIQEYESSDEAESDKEEEEGKNTPITFKLLNRKIDDEAVTKYLIEHFEGSANPNRPAASKTPRVNKNLTVFKKFMKTIGEDKTWKYVGEHFQKIISDMYDKPSSQADAVQMLKLLFIHFCKLKVEDQKLISGVARKLKETHVSKQT